jgi:MFS family permease
MTLAIRIFFPFALGYFLASIFRSINAVIAPALVNDLGLSASDLGFASSIFFLCATIFQLPYGVLLDRFDPRKLYAGCLCLCALGAIITAVADGVFVLSAGRALIAIGASSSAVTSYKVYALWYDAEKLPLVNGFSLAAGGLGLVAGTVPVEIALQIIDWREIHLIVGGCLLVTGLFILVAAPFRKSVSTGFTIVQQINSFSIILKSPKFWRAAPLMTVVIGIYAGIATLWAGSWLRDVAQYSDAATADVLMVLASAFVLAGLLTGWLTAFAKRFGLTPMGLAASTAALFAMVLIVLFRQWTPSVATVSILWALFGFLAPLNFVMYAALGAEFPKEMGGRLNACLTLAWMLGAFLTQNIYGLVLQEFPSSNGSYSAEGHELAMKLLTFALLAALAWFVAASYWIKSKSTIETEK